MTTKNLVKLTGHLVVTLIGTFTGVYWAVHLSELSQEKTEKEVIASLLKHARHEILLSRSFVSGCIKQKQWRLLSNNALVENPLNPLAEYAPVAKHAPNFAFMLQLRRWSLRMSRARLLSLDQESQDRIVRANRYLAVLVATDNELKMGQQFLAGTIGDDVLSKAIQEMHNAESTSIEDELRDR